jgi:GT2 family glycosyltransferase
MSGNRRIAVITIASGRHDHLGQQHQGLARGSTQPHDYFVVAMNDPHLTSQGPSRVFTDRGPQPRILHLRSTAPGLPLAAARNMGAAAAQAAEAELMIFLDVDCIPSPRMLDRYQRAADTTDRHLLCGPVAYLPPKLPTGYPTDRLSELAAPHPARPAPLDGHTLDTNDHTLFWSLSFAVTPRAWQTIGGFSEAYLGYGGEDTDFGQRACQAGIGIRWVGGATAFHQHHPVSDPPTEHLHDILYNATIFHRTWGWWPMTGWLTKFANLGLIRFDSDHNVWTATNPSSSISDHA